MMIALGVLALLILLFVRPVSRSAQIVDGDTIIVSGRKWRIIGYDSPEYYQPGGKASALYLKRLLASSRHIALITGYDVYGRKTALLFSVRGTLAWRMVISGHAHGKGFTGFFAEAWARIRRRGIWAKGERPVHPRIWRMMNHRGPQNARSKPMPRWARDTGSDGRGGLRLPGGFRIP